ncbi:MAG: hypothetical protein P4M07_18135 [Xanthobacteraceae bacterium]|nr:hypothetical protein [Xanthobacteraceae bacterium]
MSCPLFVRFSVAIPAVALLLAGCANSSSSVANANANASTASATAPAKPQTERFGSYGISNRGYSTNLAAEINSAVTGEEPDAPETKVAAAVPAGSVPATAAAPGSGAKTAARGTSPTSGNVSQAQASGQPQVAQNQNPPQDPPKSKAQQAEDNVPGLYGTPRAPQKDVVHWLLETTKDE